MIAVIHWGWLPPTLVWVLTSEIHERLKARAQKAGTYDVLARSTVDDHLHALEKKGLVTITQAGPPRKWQVVS